MKHSRFGNQVLALFFIGLGVLVPMILCLIATHIFMSHSIGYVSFDTGVLLADLLLIYPAWNDLKIIFLKPQSKWI